MMIDPQYPEGGKRIARAPKRGNSTLNAAYLAAIVDSCDDAIIGKDLLGNIQSWNRGAQEIFGYAPDEVIGRPVRVLFPPDRLDEEELIIERIRNGEKVDHYETVRRRKNGSHFPVAVTISPIFDVSGTVVGASKVLRDITERFRAQIELEEAKAELERVVAERTKALADRNLLLREVYHRVKNNLQVVDGLLFMHAVKITDIQAKEVLRDSRSRVYSLALVHEQLMCSSNLKTFDIGPFLTELAINIVDGAADSRVKLLVNACPLDVGLDLAVPLGLLLTEIITNSVKHAFTDGTGEIVVTLQVDDRKRLMLIVADNGRGAVPDPGPIKTGTGASIIRKLVTQLSGEMAICREAGTRIKILLPLAELS